MLLDLWPIFSFVKSIFFLVFFSFVKNKSIRELREGAVKAIKNKPLKNRSKKLSQGTRSQTTQASNLYRKGA